MADIYLGLAVMLMICIAAFVTGRAIVRRVPRRVAGLIAFADLVALLLFIKFVWDEPVLTKLIPLRNVIVLGNLQPPIAALLAGLAWGLIRGSVTRKMLFVAPLIAVSLWRGYGRLFDATPVTRERWKGDVCRQTSNATCSDAACATLLRAFGIAASETEMAGLSLTRADGTTVHGRYRGLVIKTAGTRWRVEPIVGANVKSLREMAATPLIISVGLPKGATGDIADRYVGQYGWLPGMRHTVVLFGFTPDGQLNIGDPSVGRERWDAQDLEVLWQGNGFRLVPR